MNNKGFVATVSVFTVFIFSLLMITMIVKAINYQNNNTNYVVKETNNKLNNKERFVQIVKKIK